MIKKYMDSKKYKAKFLIGPNGSGKTFTLRKLLSDYEGKSIYISEEGNLDIRMKRINVIPDLEGKYYLFNPQSNYYGEVEGRKKIQTVKIDEKLIPLIEYCSDELNYYNKIKNKSKGQEKVANIFNIIYKCFLNPIKVIFIDEPENFLDDLGLRKVSKLFELIEESRIKLVVSSHNYNLCNLLKINIDNIIFIDKIFDEIKSIYINRMFSIKTNDILKIYEEESLKIEKFLKKNNYDTDGGIQKKLDYYKNQKLLKMYLNDVLFSEQFYRSLFYKKIVLIEGATEKRIISKLKTDELHNHYYFITFGKAFMPFFYRLFSFIGKDVNAIIDSDKVMKKKSSRYGISYGLTQYLEDLYGNNIIVFDPDLEGFFGINKSSFISYVPNEGEAKVYASDEYFSKSRNKNKFIEYINKDS